MSKPGRRNEVGAAFFVAAALVHAQAPLKEISIRTHAYTPPSATLLVESNLVETALTARDSHGRAIAGLHASDFELLDNGKPREIASFTEVAPAAPAASGGIAAANFTQPAANPSTSAAPRFVTFFFDDEHVANGSMAFVKQGARKFIAEGIRPGDHLSIVTTSGQGDLEFTTDAKLFGERIEHLAAHVRPVVTDTHCGLSVGESYILVHNLDGEVRERAIAAAKPCAGCEDDSAQCRATALSVAQDLAEMVWQQLRNSSTNTISALNFAANRLAQRNGTRILALTSAGFLIRPGIPPELGAFIDRALRSNIVVNAIGAQGLTTYSGGLAGAFALMPLQNIANGTGGRYIKNTNDLAGAMQSAIEPEVHYTMAFNPGSADGKYHTLKIRMKSKTGYDLEFRPGYFSPDPKKSVSARARMDDAVFSNETLREFPVRVALSTGQVKDGAIPLSVHFTVDVRGLNFNAFHGRKMQQLVFLSALLDSKGDFVSGEESIMDLALTPEKLSSLQATGLGAIATLKARVGAFQIRAIVREGMKGKLAAVSSPIALRLK